MKKNTERVQKFLDEIQQVCIKHDLILVAANMDGYMQVYDLWKDDWSRSDIQNASDKTREAERDAE